MATLTLDQKRLSQLRTQLYGKPEGITPKKSLKNVKSGQKEVIDHTDHQNSSFENYIKKDLTKVFFLSAIILFLQFAIHFALVNKWLVINFYGITY